MTSNYSSITTIKEKTLKSVDAWWTVLVVDPLVIRVLWGLERIWPKVTPNQITMLSLLTGVGAAYSFYLGEEYRWYGAILYQVSFFLDCVDGKWARLKDIQNPFGGFLDGLVNHTVYILCVIGLVLGQPGNEVILVGGALLLFLRALHNYINGYITRPDPKIWSPIVPKSDSTLRRFRLLAPFSGPDRMSLLFTIGPILNLTEAAMIFVILIETLLLIPKFRLSFKTLSDS